MRTPPAPLGHPLINEGGKRVFRSSDHFLDFPTQAWYNVENDIGF